MPEPTPDTAPTLRVVTASGTVCEIDEVNQRVRRFPDPAEASPGFESAELRRDTQWIRYHYAGPIRYGHPLEFVLEPLGDPAVTDATIRTSTPVVRIERLPADV